ncbi:MAG: glutamate racemase [Thermodesulfobacteriota bacterium]
MKNKPIGIFDSGIGGLTVHREIAEILPGEDLLYLGDSARVPYGTKSRDIVTRFSVNVAEFLLSREVKMIVVACNTATAYALDELRSQFDVPIIGVIEPGARAAVSATESGRVGVIGTEGTMRSGAYFDAIKSIDQKVSVYLKACPLFVPLAEEGFLSNELPRLAATEYLECMKQEGVDTLVLGCTHYPLLKGVIQDELGDGVTLIDSAVATAEAVNEVLTAEKLLRRPRKRGAKHTFCVTDSPERFIKVGEKFLDREIPGVELVDLGA